ncbi:HelD family protein [Kitasatospora sp. HPMI-4]|uniref:HelD family protein n=1 Tax=Kitasatospora sp. HPMI-4 TaxID=3448443 RepID=UPI003F1B7C36
MSSKEIAREQEHVTRLYRRLDALREETSSRLAGLPAASAGGTAQARVEREVAHGHWAERLAQLDAAEQGLCFGRLDLSDGDRRYIGRLGLLDGADSREPLLIDWRAPAARPFYLATAVSPCGVRRRRHLRSAGRTVVGLHDEVLDLDQAEPAGDGGVTGEAALLAALNAGRTGRMTDIVATIQSEQDRIIRADHRGVLVVQGGPGTGKTAVALHRAAYLLYAHREQLARRVVLVVGPNATFLRYIGRVLPSLGETSVLLSTVGELYPGVMPERTEHPRVAEVKGRSAMAEVVAAAVRDRQWVPDDALEIDHEGEVLRLDRHTCARVRRQARDSGLPHNRARPLVVRGIVDALATQWADRIGADVLGGPGLLDEQDVEDLRRELRESPGVRAAIDELWPVLTPQRLLADLFRSADRIAAAAPGLTPREQRLLLREEAGGWAPSDAPLLDEAAELLGEDDRAAVALAERGRHERLEYAQGVLDVALGSRSTDQEDGQESETLSAFDLLDAGRLAERHEEVDRRTAAERAAADRTWTFGHVIVDEAQELSEMAWRLLMRRCPTRSMTVVGDIAQTGDPAGTTSWHRVLDPYAAGRWRLERLSLNYRTPAEIMAVAADVLAVLDPALEVPRSVRATGAHPSRYEVRDAELPLRLGEIAAREAAGLDGRRLAVIVPEARLAELGGAVTAAVPAAAIGEDPQAASAVVVLGPRQAKGLEYDRVLVVEPAQIVAGAPRGLGDLYVALTRATQRLGVVHSGRLPAVLDGLSGGHRAPRAADPAGLGC